ILNPTNTSLTEDKKSAVVTDVTTADAIDKGTNQVCRLPNCTRCFSDGLTYLPDIKDGDIKLAFMELMAVNWAEIPDTFINKTKRALSKSTEDKASHEALANLLHVAEAVE
ncbi:succinate dehydrogenase subunit 5, mitochondrial-like protein, partial [Tanacetum coccineum]